MFLPDKVVKKRLLLSSIPDSKSNGSVIFCFQANLKKNLLHIRIFRERRDFLSVVNPDPEFFTCSGFVIFYFGSGKNENVDK